MGTAQSKRCAKVSPLARPMDGTLDMSLIDSVERLRAGLDFHMARHNVLTANLAHLDTPNYKALDLVRSSPNANFTAALSSAMEATGAAGESQPLDANTLAQSPQTLTARGWEVREAKEPTGADGNAVSLDSEAVKIADNQLRYDMVAQLASSELASLSWAANDGRSG